MENKKVEFSFFTDGDLVNYLVHVRDLYDTVPTDKIMGCVGLMKKAYEADKQIFVFGNGGSASLASHFANDIGKGLARHGRKRFRIMSLNDNISTLTAYANDQGYEYVFVEQLKNLMNSGDLVIGISVSGTSANVLNALVYAKEYGAITMAWTGKGTQRRLGGFVDVLVEVDSVVYGHVEDVHCAINHAIGSVFREAFYRGFGKNVVES